LRAARRLFCAGVLLVPVLCPAADPMPAERATAAFHNQKAVQFTPEISHFGRKLRVGNVLLGQLLPGKKPADDRPNVYITIPGNQYGATPGAPGFTLVLNELPRKEGTVDWDVYWALRLDPALEIDITGERELILTAQESFVPAAAVSFGDLPAAAALREYLHIDSFAGLDGYRRPDGALPRVLIVPAGFAVRASAVDPDNPPPCAAGEGPLSRAVSKLSRRCPQPPAKAAHPAKPPADAK
jgi:hypothetical protein